MDYTATDYITAIDFKSAQELSGESYADNEIATAITTASRAIDDVCSRRFYPDDDASHVRYYSPANPSLLEINDLIELTEVAVSYDGKTFPTLWTENDDFLLSPLNAQEDGVPWEDILALSTPIPTGLRRVRVTGKFGWNEAPSGVKSATLMLSIRLVKRVREAPFGILSLGGMEGFTAATRIARQDPDVMSLIQPLQRLLIG